MGQAALAGRAWEAGLDRLDDAGCTVTDDQKRIAEPACTQILEEGHDSLGILFRPRHQAQENLLAVRGDAPSGEHRLALLPRPDALGNAVDEEVDDLVLAEITPAELLIVGP